MAKNLLHTKAEVVRDHLTEPAVEEGVIDAVVGSTNVLDRMGDVITQDGWVLDNYTKNPVILWGHNVKEERPPIGKALKVWVDGKQQRTKKLMFQVKFDLQDSFAAEIFRKVKDGFINTVSVGFLPTEWEEMDKGQGPFGGRKYTKQELLELSFVPVPANPEAIVALRSLSQEDKRFEPVELQDLYPEVKDDQNAEQPVVEESKKEDVVEEVVAETPANPETPKEETPVVAETPVVPEVPQTPETPVVTETPTVPETPVVEEKTPETPAEDKKEEEKNMTEEVKGVIGYSDHGMAPETEGWDGPGEMAACKNVSDLKTICTWFDSANADNKGAYKLPHHHAEGFKAVWRGVAAAMAALLGARGGVEIPEGDRKGVYNHLKKHYDQFGKEAPDFKMVEDQVLAHLEDEVQALVLDREDKHEVRLIKKVLKKQNSDSQKLIKALSVLNEALDLVKSNPKRKGGEK